MTLLRLGSFAATISLSSCLVTTAPEPSDFKLSHEVLSRKYAASRKTGVVRLYAQKIETTRDQWGRESHRATGGSLLVKGSSQPIFAEASNISVTPEFSEAFGRSTVKKNDRLFIGQDESTTIRIEGAQIIPHGPVLTRRVAMEDATRPAFTPETFLPPLQPALAQEKPKKVSKPKRKAATAAGAGTATKPEAPPAANNAHLLKLMRDPTER